MVGKRCGALASADAGTAGNRTAATALAMMVEVLGTSADPGSEAYF